MVDKNRRNSVTPGLTVDPGTICWSRRWIGDPFCRGRWLVWRRQRLNITVEIKALWKYSRRHEALLLEYFSNHPLLHGLGESAVAFQNIPKEEFFPLPAGTWPQNQGWCTLRKLRSSGLRRRGLLISCPSVRDWHAFLFSAGITKNVPHIPVEKI